MPAVAKLGQILALDKADLVVILGYEAAAGVFALVVPVAIQMLVNTVIFNFLLQPIIVLASLVVGFLFLAALLKLAQTRVIETLQTRLFTRISMELAYRLPRTRMEAFDSHRGTELLNRFFEIVTVQKGLALILVDGLTIVLQSAIGMTLLAFYHPALLAFDFALICCIVVVVFIPSKKGVKTSIKECGGKYAVAAWLEEVARNPLAFRLGGIDEYALARANEATFEYLERRKNHFQVLFRQIRGTFLVQTVISGLFLGIGSMLVIRKQLSLGQLVASELIVTMVLARISKLGKYIETFYDLTASADKLTSLLSLPLETFPNEVFAPPQGAFGVGINQVGFSYLGSVNKAVVDLNLEIPPGSRVGIIGGNGAGKSTLFDLILGVRSPSSGSITVAKHDLRDFDLTQMRRHVALVRDVEFIEGTILENIRMGRVHISLSTIRQTLDELGLLNELTALPDGLATRLSGSINPLSAGQAHGLMLARAIVGAPKLLLIDETLDVLDAASIQKAMDILLKREAPWTLVIASHNREILKGCEQIYDLHIGQLTKQSLEPGTVKS